MPEIESGCRFDMILLPHRQTPAEFSSIYKEMVVPVLQPAREVEWLKPQFFPESVPKREGDQPTGEGCPRKNPPVSGGFFSLFLTKTKRATAFAWRFVAFRQQPEWKGIVILLIPLFGDCMTDRVLYFQPRKRGGGSSVF